MASKGDIEREKRIDKVRRSFHDFRLVLKEIIKKSGNLANVDGYIATHLYTESDRNFVKKAIIDINGYAPSKASTMGVIFLLDRLPKDGSYVKRRNRCKITGYPRSVFRKYGICRHKLRDLFNEGFVPGVYKASW